MNIEQSHLITLSTLVKKIYQESSTHSAEDFKEVYLYQTKVLDLLVTKEMFEGENIIFKGWEKDMEPSEFVDYHSFVHLKTKREIRFYSNDVLFGYHDPLCSFFPLACVHQLAELSTHSPLELYPIYIEE